jgi:hypothetical protein
MLVLSLILLVMLVALSIFLWASALFLQGYFYSEPSSGLVWRAPAAGAAMTAFVALWCLLNYAAGDPGSASLPFTTLDSFNPTVTLPKEPHKSFKAVKKGKEVTYRQRKNERGKIEYLSDDGRNRPWSPTGDGMTDAIIWVENDAPVKFVAQGDAKAGYRYVEEGGRRRVLTPEDVSRGQVTVFRFGLFVGNVLLNLLHFAAWFACVWLLLRFQWHHALGFAVVMWLVMTFAVLPPVFTQTREAVRQKGTRAAPAKAQAVGRLDAKARVAGAIS